MTDSLRTLTNDLIDYAGLFPPAKLDMSAAVETYNRCKVGEHESMLGRFICPASRLAEFTKEASPFLPGTYATSGYRGPNNGMEPWRLSVLIDSDFSALPAALDTIDAFNAHHDKEANGQCAIDMIELKVTDANQIDAALDEIPEDLFPFFEFPVSLTEGIGDCRGFVAALAGNHGGAKIRTGGLVGAAFPTAAEIAAFMHACASVDVPFKATAGLHHPVRAVHPLTYEKGSPTFKMHGFLNVFLAAAVAKVLRPDIEVTKSILSGDDPADFKFGEEVLGWKSYLLTTPDLARVRESFALSFGSCSFDEPVEELKGLGWL